VEGGHAKDRLIGGNLARIHRVAVVVFLSGVVVRLVVVGHVELAGLAG
jgi:hypothetical protein